MDGAEVARHNSNKSCWIVLNRQVYDVTSYLEQHPGGAAILLTQGGSDATTEFSKIHSADVLRYLPEGAHLGPVDGKTLGALARPGEEATSSPTVEEGQIPHLVACIATEDFERAAKVVLPARSWSYVSSFSNTGLSMAANLGSWSSINFRPRILRDVETVTTRTSILGQESSLPFYVSPMGLLGRAHDEAELAMVRGFVRSGVHGVISTVSTKPTEDVVAAHSDQRKERALASSDGDRGLASQLHFQLYTNPDRADTTRLIERAKAAGYKSLWVTVDTPILGKRTIDRRQMAEDALAVGMEQQASNIGLGIQTHVSQNQFRPAMDWKDLQWIREAWGGPIVLKGIQRAEDAKLAMEHGCQGILLSNHGGRQLHSAPDALSTLLEIRCYCPEVLEKMEVFVDGGLRDGADVLKALCLGARAVGVGRPFLYALAAYGTAGVERCVDVLAEELRTAMGLLGITSLDQVHPDMVNSSRLLNEIWRPWKSRTRKSRL